LTWNYGITKIISFTFGKLIKKFTGMIRDLIKKNRSYRRFDHNVKINPGLIKNWIELARFSASGRNMQPLKYCIITDEKMAAEIFQNLGWAGYLSDWNGPEENERPVAYVVVMHDKSLSEKYYCDDGIALQSILLGAVESGFGGCIIGSVNKGKLSRLLSLPEQLEILYVLALGKPVEKVVIEDLKNNEIKYWRDAEQVHHVPKRTLEELIYKLV
jgi:nitroreductase